MLDFLQARTPDYLEITLLVNRIVPTTHVNKTDVALTVASELVVKIVTSQVCENTTEDKSIEMLLRENILATNKDGTSVLQVRKGYRNLASMDTTSLMSRTNSSWDDTYTKLAEVSTIQTVVIVTIDHHHASKKRARD